MILERIPLFQTSCTRSYFARYLRRIFLPESRIVVLEIIFVNIKTANFIRFVSFHNFQVLLFKSFIFIPSLWECAHESIEDPHRSCAHFFDCLMCRQARHNWARCNEYNNWRLTLHANYYNSVVVLTSFVAFVIISANYILSCRHSLMETNRNWVVLRQRRNAVDTRTLIKID